MSLKTRKIISIISFIFTTALFVFVNFYIFEFKPNTIEKLILLLIMCTQFISLFYVGAYFGDFTDK